MAKLLPRTGIEAPGFDRLSDRVYDKLHQAILDGQFPPGTRLIELKLAKHFKVGRTPLREALLRLAADGLVQGVPSMGFFVKHVTLSDMNELFQIRAALECLAVRLAMERGFSDISLLELRQTCTRLNAALAAGDVRGANIADLDFHRGLINLANSSRLESAIRSAHLQMLAWDHRRGDVMNVQDEQNVVDEHLQILDAIQRRDPEEATRLLNNHITVAFKLGLKAAIEQKVVDAVIEKSKPVGDLS